MDRERRFLSNSFWASKHEFHNARQIGLSPLELSLRRSAEFSSLATFGGELVSRSEGRRRWVFEAIKAIVRSSSSSTVASSSALSARRSQANFKPSFDSVFADELDEVVVAVVQDLNICRHPSSGADFLDHSSRVLDFTILNRISNLNPCVHDVVLRFWETELLDSSLNFLAASLKPSVTKNSS